MLNLQERANLVTLYCEPQRHYHTIEHINSCFRELDAFEDEADDADRDGFCSVVVEKALWFHDCVYDPKAVTGKNEKDSMTIAYHHLSQQFRSINDSLPMEVAEIIEKTDHKSVAETTNQKVTLDIDLSVLGASDADYLAYSRNIRREYLHVEAHVYRLGRTHFLHSILCKDRIYYTNYFFNKYEAKARKNIQMEIDNLHLWV